MLPKYTYKVGCVLRGKRNHLTQQTSANKKRGVVTDDNNSVSPANIMVHYVIQPISSTLNQAEIFKTFMYVIILISYGDHITFNIERTFSTAFKKAAAYN